MNPQDYNGHVPGEPPELVTMTRAELDDKLLLARIAGSLETMHAYLSATLERIGA